MRPAFLFRRALGIALALAVLLTAGLALNGLLLSYALFRQNQWGAITVSECAASLTHLPDGGYALPETLVDRLEKQNAWIMLLGADGSVDWSFRQPEDVPSRYTIPEVAGFTRWYLNGYPVKVRAVDDHLLVLGAPKESVWKYSFEAPLPSLAFWPLFLLAILFCNFLLILIVAIRTTKGWYQKRDAARTEWIAAVSHDVRTPLSVMLGYASNLENDAALPETTRTQAGVIRAKGEQLRALIADLNLTNRLAHAMAPLQVVRTPIAPLLRRASADLLNSETTGMHAVDVCIAPDAEPLQLRCDPALLTRMLNNLIGNSIRHNPGGCTVTVTLARRGLGCTLSVADDGTGYPPEQLATLNQKRNRRSESNGGHGFGLVIVKQIAAAHHAACVFSNNTSGGSCCKIHFPLALKTR